MSSASSPGLLKHDLKDIGLEPGMQCILQGVPKVRSYLTFANKTGYNALGRVYYRPVCFHFVARHFATRCEVSGLYSTPTSVQYSSIAGNHSWGVWLPASEHSDLSCRPLWRRQFWPLGPLLRVGQREVCLPVVVPATKRRHHLLHVR